MTVALLWLDAKTKGTVEETRNKNCTDAPDCLNKMGWCDNYKCGKSVRDSVPEPSGFGFLFLLGVG